MGTEAAQANAAQKALHVLPKEIKELQAAKAAEKPEKAETRTEETDDSRPCSAGGAHTKKRRNMPAWRFPGWIRPGSERIR
jgi:hypothetical protein